MSSTKAVVITPVEGSVGVEDVPVPKLRDQYMLIKVHAIALNPTDWKAIDMALANVGSKIGCDYAGVVLEAGIKVTKFKQGDRVCGFVNGGYVQISQAFVLLTDQSQKCLRS